jgi:rod shape-determining protein MreC
MVSDKPSNTKSFKSGKNFNFILILFCLILVFLGKLDLIAIRNIKAFLSDFLAPITFALNKPVKELAVVFEDVKSAGSLREENIRLKSEVRKLRVINSKTSSQELELLELRELLKVLPESKNKIVTGRAITSPGGVFANTVLINAGKDYGIVIGQPAISSVGLVGYVVNVSLKTSRILLIMDINSMIPVYLTSSNWPAVVQGQNGKLLKIKFLSSKAKPVEGEFVQTSGHGGRLPPGVNVGKVVKSFSGKYYVKPAVDFHRLTYISIITNKSSSTILPKSFDGFAPLQKPEPSINLKGLNLGGKRISESTEIE